MMKQNSRANQSTSRYQAACVQVVMMLINQIIPKLLIKNTPGLCYNCHKEANFKGTSGHTAIGMCTGCHNPHSSNSNKILLGDQPGLCYNCHDKAKFTKKYVHGIINIGGCTSCHVPHQSSNPSLLPNPVYELCISCHSPQSKGQHVIALPGKKISSCKRCY